MSRRAALPFALAALVVLGALMPGVAFSDDAGPDDEAGAEIEDGATVVETAVPIEGPELPAWKRRWPEPLRLGPLPGRTKNPLYLQHLQPSPRRARVLDEGQLELGFQVDWSNLYDTWKRIVPNGRQISDLDMEIVRTAFSGRFGLPFGIELGVEVPLLSYVGGVTDPWIQAWHGLLNAENGGREDDRDRDFAYEVLMPGQVHVDYPSTRLGLGDITTELHVQILRPGGPIPGVSARFLVKLPTGDEDKGLGSGAGDVGALLNLEHGWRRLALFGHVGALVRGRTGPLGSILTSVGVTYATTFELGLTRHWSLVVGIQGSSRFHSGFVHRFMKWSPMGLTAGTRVRIGDFDFGFGMEQDVLNGDPSSDVALVFDASFRVGGRANRLQELSTEASETKDPRRPIQSPVIP